MVNNVTQGLNSIKDKAFEILGNKVIENVNVGQVAFTAVSDYLGF